MIEYLTDPYHIPEMIRNKEIAAIKLPDESIILAEDIKEVIFPDGTTELV